MCLTNLQPTPGPDGSLTKSSKERNRHRLWTRGSPGMGCIRLTPFILMTVAFVLPVFAVELEGDFVQGGLVYGRVPPGSRVQFDGQWIRTSEDGRFLIGFDRDEGTTVTLMVKHPNGKSERRALTVQPRQYEIQRIDGLPPKKVTPPPEAMERIRREIALVKHARSRDDPRIDFAAGFVWPASGTVSGVYGSQRILNGTPRRPHYGVDIAAPTGTPVYAPAAGIVTLAQPDMYFSGGTIIIDHGHGLSSSFLHMSEVQVKVDERVERGTMVGKIGATGRATGSHLDWRMNLFARQVDPQLLVGPMPQMSSP